MKMPVLFVGHGSPLNALADNAWAQTLKNLGKEIPKPKAVCAVSAHWVTQGSKVLTSDPPKIIYDFYGFPQDLFAVKYPAPGAPKEARELSKKLSLASDETWGLDHGTWSVLKHLYPKADVPVFQVSLDQSKNFQEHLELGRQLQYLRGQGVLILGSGNVTHNLRKIEWDTNAKPYEWALEFDAKVKRALDERDEKILTRPDSFGPGLFRNAHPTAEHYIPLLYCLGSVEKEDRLSYPYEGIENASISMRMALWS